MSNIINVSHFMPNGGFEIWTKDRNHSVEICLFVSSKPSYRVLENDETISMSGSFENALITAVSYLNPKVDDPNMSEWCLKDYCSGAANDWWLGHGLIVRDKYLASGHGLIYYLNDGYCTLRFFNSSYHVVFHQDSGRKKDDYFKTFDDAVAFIQKIDSGYVEPNEPKDVFDVFAQSVFDRYITYADHWLQDIDYPEQKTGLMRNSEWLEQELDRIEAGWNRGGWLPYSVKEFRHKCVCYVLQKRIKGETVHWSDYTILKFSPIEKEECALFYLGDIIRKLNPLR